MDQPTTQKEVSIYSTPTCTYCKLAKAFFDEKGITYKEFDVAADADKRAEMIDISGQLGVPVIRIENDILVGFDKAQVAHLLGVAA